MAESLDAMGQTHKSIKYLNKVLNNKNYSLDRMALYKKATIYYRQKKYDRASALFQEVADKYPNTNVGRKSVAWKKETLTQLREETGIEEKYSEPEYDDSEY